MDAQTHAQHPLEGPADSAPANSAPANSAPANSAQAPAPPDRRLDIQEPGDCLALVRHTFGSLPPESLIVIGLLGGFTGGHMRIDLQPALRDPFSSARLIADCLAGEGSAPAPEAAVVVLISAEPPSADADPAWRSCIDALRMVLESEYCVRIVQCWFLAADFVRDPDCLRAGCCELPGRGMADVSVPNLEGADGPRPRPQALAEAAESFLARAPAADPELLGLLDASRRRSLSTPERGAKSGPLPQTDTLGPTDSGTDRQERRRRLEAWDAALRRQECTFRRGAAGTGLTPRVWQEPGVPGVPAWVQADGLEQLLAQLRSGFDRDLLIPLATLGLDVALVGLSNAQGLTQSCGGAAEQQALRDYSACYLGETGARPDWERVDALEGVLSGLVPYAKGIERENLLCLMAWIEWARGRGSAAGAFIDRCVEEFPANEFSRLIERLMQLKGVCLWARVKQHSWSWARNFSRGPE